MFDKSQVGIYSNSTVDREGLLTRKPAKAGKRVWRILSTMQAQRDSRHTTILPGPKPSAFLQASTNTSGGFKVKWELR